MAELGKLRGVLCLYGLPRSPVGCPTDFLPCLPPFSTPMDVSLGFFPDKVLTLEFLPLVCCWRKQTKKIQNSLLQLAHNPIREA